MKAINKILNNQTDKGFLDTERLLVYILIFFILFTNQLISNEVTNIVINPLNRVVIKFDTLPQKIESELSDSKTLIKLDIGQTKINDKYRQLTGLGIISDVFVSNEAAKTILNIKAKERRGYTISYLRFSNQAIVDVFLWDKLSSDEELLRTGLIALEEKIYPETISSLYKTLKSGNNEGAYYLGMAYLETGNFQQAITVLNYAYHIDSTIIDALAGLALAHNQMGNYVDYENFANKFKEKCNCRFDATFNFNKIELDTTMLDLSHLVIPAVDSLNSDSTDIVLSDTISKVNIDSLNSLNKVETIFDTIERYLIYGFIIVGLTFALFIYYYWKWRKEQMSKREKAPTQKFDDSLQAAQSKINTDTLKKMYKAGDLANDSKTETPAKHEQKVEKESEIISREKMDKLGSVIESITGKPAASYKLTTTIPNVNAKLQLAMHLAVEQRKVKTQNLENLKTANIPTDKKKLSEVSKKLGIEKGGLETKAAMEKILKDKDKLKKLNDKFGS